VTRGVGLIFALISLAVVGGLFAMSGKNQGPAAPAVTHAESLALVTAAEAAFQPVDQMLQVDYSQTGTYAGAELAVGTGVTVVQASTASYCLQMNVNGTLVHEVGPGGSAAVGPC
jgi:hypothetical protein